MTNANKHNFNAPGTHVHNEEENDYSAEYDALYDDDFLDDGDIEHASIRELVEQLEAMQPEDDLYDSITRSEQVEPRIRDEEYEVFPLAKKSKSDTSALGAQLLKRKIELMKELALSDEYEEDIRDSNNSKKKSRSTHGRAA